MKIKKLSLGILAISLGLSFGVQALPSTCPNPQDVLTASIQNQPSISLWDISQEEFDPLTPSTPIAFSKAEVDQDTNTQDPANVYLLPFCTYSVTDSGAPSSMILLTPDLEQEMGLYILLDNASSWSGPFAPHALDCVSNNVANCSFTTH